MLFSENLVRKVGTICLSFLWMILIGYFIYFILLSDRSVFVLNEVNGELNNLRVKYDEISTQVFKFETKVSRLQEDSMDLDYLEELGRGQLNLLQNNETMLSMTLKKR